MKGLTSLEEYKQCQYLLLLHQLALAKLFKELVGWSDRQQVYCDDTKIPILREKTTNCCSPSK